MSDAADGNLQGKRLVVFGCGYVGGEVARQAAARGAQVTALTRNPAKAAALRADGIETVVDDLAAAGWHARVAGGADFILDAVSSGGSGVAGYQRSHVEGMASIIRWAQSTGGAGTFIYTSSTSVYPQSGGAAVDEEAAVGNHGRAALLVNAETQARGAADAWRRCFILRLAGIYGPGRRHLLPQVRQGEVSGSGDHRLNLVHRDDILRAIWACFEAPPSLTGGVFNVVDDQPAPKAEVVNWLAAQAGLAPPRFTGQPAPGRELTADRAISNEKIKAVLAWRPAFLFGRCRTVESPGFQCL